MEQQMKFLTGRVEITPQDEADELMKELVKDREALTKAIDSLLRSKGYKVNRVIHDQSGRIFADIQDQAVPVFSKKPIKPRTNKKMATGWSRGFVGFTRELRSVLSEYRKKGRKSIPFDELYEEMMDIFRDRQGKKFRKMDEAKFAGYLHDKRYFPTLKYNSVERIVRF